MKKKSSDKNRGIAIRLLVDKKKFAPYKDQSVDFPDVEAKLCEP